MDFTLMRQSILVGEAVYTSTPDDILVVVRTNLVQSDWWWASPSNVWLVGMVSNEKRLAALTSQKEVKYLPLVGQIFP